MRSVALMAVALLVALDAPGIAGAAPADAPKRKSGLWDIKVSGLPAGGLPAIQQCVDQKSDDLWDDDPTGTGTKCSKYDVRREGGRVIADSVCKIEQSTATTRSVFTGSFDSAYRADSKSTYQPPLHGMREATMVIEARWVGPCKPGQKPGDVVLPGMPSMEK